LVYLQATTILLSSLLQISKDKVSYHVFDYEHSIEDLGTAILITSAAMSIKQNRYKKTGNRTKSDRVLTLILKPTVAKVK